MHLAEAPPDALVVDSPQLLRNEPSEATSPARAPLQRRERSTHASPASHRPAHRHELMHAACAIALAAHAADGLPRSRGDVSSVRGGEAPPPPPCVLCVGFSERILEPEIPRRWLRYELNVQNSLGARSHEYSISCTQWPCGTASLPTSFIADRRVLLLDEGKNSQHVEGYPTFNLSALHTPESQSRQFCANGTHTGTPSLVEVRLLPAV
ncbi:hypothetical protein AB1Y20_009480 [Prymnesium parvum]|uniref:Uncharacterized protein n=1 Tax=Prymnesium parvum TaxID=97485 RepID=A0AB34K4W1_PRYPA